MKRYWLIAVVAALLLPAAWQETLAADADCDITCTVADIVEWEAASFANITLANITSQGVPVSDSAELDLYINGDVDITADNTVTAELSEAGGDTLVTEYQLEYDGNGVAATGGATVSWTAYGTFLDGAGSAVTHFSKDGAVGVTLSARASCDTGNVPDAAAYSATQTLTATWH